jgi:hypothetical protein
MVNGSIYQEREKMQWMKATGRTPLTTGTQQQQKRQKHVS